MLYSAFPLRKFFKESLTHGPFNLCVNEKTVRVNDSPYFQFWSHTVPPPSPIPIKTRKLSYRKNDHAMRPICGLPEKFDSPWVCPQLLHAKFLMCFCSDRSYECGYKILKFVALPVPKIIAIAVLSWGCKPQSWGREGRRGSGSGTVGLPFERALVSSYRP